MSRTSHNVLIVAGEASGDRHAARLVAAIRAHRPDAEFWGIGGGLLREQGVETLFDAGQMNVVGFIEVLKRYRFFRRVFRTIASESRRRHPTLAILVDYPGFNIRLAAELHKAGIPVLYYIAPQVWAWKEGRVQQLRRYVNDLIVVFPFEVEFFSERGITPRFFGHPLVDQLAELRARNADADRVTGDESRRRIAYLPGSRPEEIQRHMPLIREVMKMLGPGYRHVIPQATTIPRELLERYRGDAEFEIVGSSYEALSGASAALVKSGTSTLDATLLDVPFTVMYRTSGLTYRIARRLIKVPYIAMTNVLAKRKIVREFIQDDVTPEGLAGELRRLMEDGSYREEIRKGLHDVRELLGPVGATRRVADFILQRYLP